jgi:putative NIF3 family GTP cyclohydrolase 1 type 2
MNQTRRDFINLVSAALAATGSQSISARASAAPLPALTIEQAIDRIKAAVPARPVANTVDTIKMGDASKPLRAIATTFLATCEVIQKAAGLEANLVISHEPIFYNHRDETDWLKGDSVLEYKRQLIGKHGLVVWRFHDFWHQRNPDPMTVTLMKNAGLPPGGTGEQEGIVEIPPVPLSELALTLKQKLGLPAVRFAGNPKLVCRKVGIAPGAAGGQTQILGLSRMGLDVVVCGEISEWETNEYARDAAFAGINRGVIVLGHVHSEEPGMKLLADWLPTVLPGVPVNHVPAGDPFSRL